jgi:outer membrane protein TolC
VRILLITVCISFIALQNGWAQRTDFDKIVTPVEKRSRDFQEYLVQLAWLNNPSNDNLVRKVKIAESDDELTKMDWLNNLGLTLNLNEANFQNQVSTDPGAVKNIFFPRYNFSANFRLGELFNTATKRKINKQKIRIAEGDVNQRKLYIRAEALKRYQDYILAQEVYKTRTQAEEDANAMFVLMSKQFKNGTSRFDEYNQASSTFFNAQEANLRSKSEVTVSKLRLEEMIGMKWEEVQQYYNEQ